MCAGLTPLLVPTVLHGTFIYGVCDRRHRQVFRGYFLVLPGSPASFLTHSLVLSKTKTAGAMTHSFLKSAGLWGRCLAKLMEMISEEI